MILFTSSVVFLQIKMFSIKNSISNYFSRHKKNQFCLPNRQKVIKRAVLVS